MISSPVANKTTQLALWESPAAEKTVFALDDFPITLTLPFRWANGDTSDQAAQQMLSQVQGKQRYLWGGTFIHHRLVTYYVNVLEAWIDQGVVYGKCLLWPEGRYIDELRAGEVSEEEEEENYD